MKNNVDLTENRDFRKQIPIDKITVALKTKQIYPWEYNLNTKFNELLFTGDKKDRKRKINWSNYEQGLNCEKCGFDFSKSPWNGDWGICFKCENEMHEQKRIEDDLVLNYPKHMR